MASQATAFVSAMRALRASSTSLGVILTLTGPSRGALDRSFLEKILLLVGVLNFVVVADNAANPVAHPQSELTSSRAMHNWPRCRVYTSPVIFSPESFDAVRMYIAESVAIVLIVSTGVMGGGSSIAFVTARTCLYTVAAGGETVLGAGARAWWVHTRTTRSEIGSEEEGGGACFNVGPCRTVRGVRGAAGGGFLVGLGGRGPEAGRALENWVWRRLYWRFGRGGRGSTGGRSRGTRSLFPEN